MQLSLSKKENVILYSGLVLLVVMVLINTRTPFFDEILYLRDVKVLHEYGLGNEFLLKLTGSAGPLYAVVHFIFEPITHFQPPFIRLINIAFLLGMIFFLRRTLSLPGFSGGSYSIYCMAIPMIYLISGLALTEMPAMFFLSMGLYIILRTVIVPVATSRQFLYFILGGLCLGIAITGRQPFLVILGALPVLFWDHKWKENILKLLVLLVSAIAIPGYIFWVWKGFVPPTDAMLYDSIARKGVSYRPDFFFLCLAYFALVFVIIAPAFYRKPDKKTWLILLACYVVIAAINYCFHWVKYLPIGTAVKRIFSSPEAVESASIFAGSGLILVACYFLFNLAIHIHQVASKKYLLFYGITLVLVALSCAKITWGFSSRYAAQAIPLLIPACSFFRRKSPFSHILMIAGVLLGALSLFSYILYME